MNMQNELNNISIIPGNLAHLADCRAAMQESELGRVYFASDEKTLSYLTVGLQAGEIYIAVNDAGCVFGFAWIKPAGAFGFHYLSVLAVKNEYRGRGIGKKLLTFFEEQGFKERARVCLLVSDFNKDAQRLYRSLGYEQVGYAPSLYLDGVDELIMIKRRPETSCSTQS